MARRRSEYSGQELEDMKYFASWMQGIFGEGRVIQGLVMLGDACERSGFFGGG